MCGRYYVDESTFREAEKLLEELNEMLHGGRSAADADFTGDYSRNDYSGDYCAGGMNSGGMNSGGMHSGDMHPGDLAPVLAYDRDGVHIRWQRWGFPGFQGGGLIFNARSESVREKRMFRDGVARHRIVVPARKFYEWNRAKEKITFLKKDDPALYMAGFYDQFEDGPHFVILTTQANASMKQTHDRMPLILGREEVGIWLSEGEEFAPILEKTPPELDKQAEYEQISFL